MMLLIKKLHEDAVIPQYATDGAACFDLVGLDYVHLHPGESAVIATGLSFEIPYGYVMLVFSRSGHGFKHGIRLVSGTGVIDSDYRGEVLIGLRNDGDEDVVIKNGDRIAQAMIVAMPTIAIKEVKELSDTERGTGGFGSTGK